MNQYFIAVALVDIYVAPATGEPLKVLNSGSIQINEVEFAKWWSHAESIQRTSGDKFTRRSGDMLPCTGERIDFLELRIREYADA